jgi:mycarose O-acyltransferase
MFDTFGGLIGMNVPSWSLGCEVFFYFAFPWLMRIIWRIRSERLWLWVAVVAVAIFAVPFVSLLLPAQPVSAWDPTIPEWSSWFVYSFPFTRMLEFILGILVARVVITGRWIRLGMVPASLLVIAGTLVQSCLPGVFHVSAGLVAFPFTLLIGASATADIRGVRTPFSGRLMVWLGEITFAFYLVHWLVIQYGPIDAAHKTGSALDASPWVWVARVLLTTVISVALAAALYTFVERPLVRRFSRPASSRQESPAAAPEMADQK